VLTAKDTITLATTPVSLTVNSASNYLYVISGTTSGMVRSVHVSPPSIVLNAAD